MRRRQPVAPAAVPPELLRFEQQYWAQPGDQDPPEYWPAGEHPLYRRIRAWKRYCAACREWRREHGMSWDEFDRLRRGEVTR